MTTRFWLVLNLLVLGLAQRPTIAQNKEQQNQGPAVKAFPSAEGFGAQSQGGRGGRVIEVTNLNDSGPGSLRRAMEASGPRICVFRVSGTITLKSAIRVCSPYLTVAGQTSPGGVQIKGTQKPQGDWGVWFVNGAHDIIIRHLRVRMGGNMQHDAGNNLLCYGTAEPGVHDVIVDHCSVCWGSDTQLDWYGSYLDRATFQWNIIAEADMGSHIGGNRAPKNITLHHNLYANLGSRTPLIQHADVFDFRNNVIYNWNGNNSAVFGQFALNTSAFGNVVDNLWLAGPESGYPYLNVGNGGPVRIDGSAANGGGTRLYISGNWGPRCPSGCTNDWTGHGINTWDYYELKGDGSTHLVDQAQYDAGKHFAAPPVSLDPVSKLLDKVLTTVGACKPSRDVIDRRIVKSVRDKTGTYHVTSGPWPNLAAGAPVPPPDSDHDGMPDAWEKAHGLDPNNLGDGDALAANGYTNVENYLNELAGDSVPGLSETIESGERPSELVFYVSPRGNDAWAGCIATPGKADGPFATIGRAQQAVRKIQKTNPQTAVRVILRGGTYYLDSPLEFSPEDSGMQGAPVVYAAAPGEKVVISGGRRLEGGTWGEVNGRKAWVIDIPEVKEGRWRFRQLFVNGERRPRTRLPNKGEYRIESLPGYTGDFLRSPTKQFVYASGDIVPTWRNLPDVEIVGITRWLDNRLPIKSVDGPMRTVTFDRPSLFALVSSAVSGDGTVTPSVYWVENVREALETPGQWYLDRPQGKLYYLPRQGEEMNSTKIIAPRLTQVVRVVGREGVPVHDLRFEGIMFSHTEWQPPGDYASSLQAGIEVPGALLFDYAERCAVTDGGIEHVGNYGVEVNVGCVDIEILRNQITDIGAGGIRIGHFFSWETDGSGRLTERGLRRKAAMPQGPHSQRITVADNVIAHCGRFTPEAVGVFVGDNADNKVVHNHICDLFWCGICVGSVQDFGPSQARGNVIEYNHVHNIGQGMLSDVAGIYTCNTPDSRVAYNVVHDVVRRDYGGWGIYMDQGSHDLLIQKNLVYRCQDGALFAHHNQNITAENNIFAFNRNAQVERGGIGGFELACRRNLIYYLEGQAIGNYGGRRWGRDVCAFDHNLYWNAAGKQVIFANRSFTEWQAAGQDVDSLIADPLFVDPEHGDFRLRPGSSAPKIGFEPWDMSAVGPVKNSNNVLYEH